jgi:DNA-binding transcriptional LysR family regulator
MAIHRSMTLQRYRLLVALADSGGVTAAARAAGISQPALSQQLRIIERHYGFPLLMRSGRRVVLTKPARLAADYARRVVRLAEESEHAMRDLRDVEAGRLSVVATQTPGAYLVPRLLAEFRARHPAVTLGLRIGSVREVERWVLEDAADLGVIGQVAEPLEAVVTPFREDELVAVMPATHPLALVARLDGTALASHPLIVPEPGSSTRQTLERALAASGLALEVQFELSGTEAILQAVAAGLGASVVSELAVAEPPLGGGRRLRVRRVAGVKLSRYLAVVRHPDSEPAPAAREFISYLARGVAPPTIPAA